MVEELSHRLLFVAHLLGDPLIVCVLLVSASLFLGVIALGAFLRLSRKVRQVLKTQKEIKLLIAEVLVSSHEMPHAEPPPPAPLPPKPEETPCSVSPLTPPPAPAPELDQHEELTPRTIVQTYRAGKSLYVLYSDGSVEADTDGHIQTFASIHLLKEAMAHKNQNAHLRSAS